MFANGDRVQINEETYPRNAHTKRRPGDTGTVVGFGWAGDLVYVRWGGTRRGHSIRCGYLRLVSPAPSGNGHAADTPQRRRGPVSRFTPGQIAEIKKRAAAGEKGRTLAREFGLSASYLSRLVSGRYSTRGCSAP